MLGEVSRVGNESGADPADADPLAEPVPKDPAFAISGFYRWGRCWQGEEECVDDRLQIRVVLAH